MIRHGETEANAARIMAGSLDSPLTENGIRQARAIHSVIETLAIKPTHIIHSHLTRARDTAALINESLRVSMHEDPDYAEFHAGDWEGVPYENCPRLLEDWIDAPNGETCAQFFTRITNAKKRALAHKDAPALVVTHGGVFRAFLEIHGIKSNGVENCKLYEFEPAVTHGGFPWSVWRYDIENTILRTPVSFFNQAPDSEIA
jgi:broad specificity phosphatase PhoE